MIYVYCQRKSSGAKDLTAWLAANGQRAARARSVTALRNVTANDLIVTWGDKLPGKFPCRVLNAEAPIGNKKRELAILAEAGLRVPALSNAFREGWYGRRRTHRSANDLLANLGRNAEYWVEPVTTQHELRVHVFQDKAFRVGMKEPRPGENHHPVFRTDAAGWRLVYNTERIRQTLDTSRYRHAAIKAVKALGYDFGAVDLGISNGRSVIFEVNSAPGLEGTTIESYGRQIIACLPPAQGVKAAPK